MPDKDDSSRREKKSETIEARVPFTTKRALLARCEAESKSLSEVLRICIEDYLASSVESERRARTKMKQTIVRYAAGVALTAGSVMLVHHGALAQPSHFAEVDANKDGRITEAELVAAHEDAAKRPRHGTAHAGAGSEWHKQLVQSEFTAAAGADGALTQDEMNGFHERLLDRAFAALDTSKDGAVDEAELTRIGHGGAPMIAKVDADGDGKITRAEFDAAHADHH